MSQGEGGGPPKVALCPRCKVSKKFREQSYCRPCLSALSCIYQKRKREKTIKEGGYVPDGGFRTASLDSVEASLNRTFGRMDR